MISERQIQILKVIIDSFIKDGNPVGSNTIKNNHQISYSSATIRNDMAYLEEVGLIEKTHTSSGRIPSSKGYRYYVDYLIVDNNIDLIIKDQLEEIFSNRRLNIDEVIQESCNLIAQMTNYTSIALGNEYKDEYLAKLEIIQISPTSIVMIIVTNTGKVENRVYNIKSKIDFDKLQNCISVINTNLIGTKLVDVLDKLENEVKNELDMYIDEYEQLVDTFISVFSRFIVDKVYVGGRNNILNQPDFNSIEKIRKLLSIMDDRSFFEQLATNVDGMSIMIGDENAKYSLEELTIVTSNYEISSSEKGVIAIVGPTRMDYDKVIAILDYVSLQISHLLNKQRGDSNE